MLILSGVKAEKRAQAGVPTPYLIERNTAKMVKKWEFCSERIFKVEMETESKQEVNIIILYGPNEDGRGAIKDAFSDEITHIFEN